MERATLWKAGAVVLAIAIWGWAGAHQKSDIPVTPSEDDPPAANTTNTADTKSAAADKVPLKGKIMDVTALKIEDEKVGTGAEAKPGQSVTVNYRGYLTDGTVFDESYKRGQPFTFALGSGQVIPGWDKGVAGMKVGGKRKLTIPPNMGYGASGQGATIPPNATLIFDVELVKVG